MDNQLQQSLTNFITIVLGGAITVASIFASIYVNKAIQIAKTKAEQIKDDDAKKSVQKTIDKMNDLIQTGITALENTTKKDILNDIALGKCDKSALDQLALDVRDNVLKQLGEGGVQILNGAVDDVNDYVSKKIEATLADLKVNPNSSVSKTVIPTEVQVDTSELKNKNIELVNVNTQLTQTVAQVQAENESLKAQLNNIQNAISNATIVQNTSAIPVQQTQITNQNITL